MLSDCIFDCITDCISDCIWFRMISVCVYGGFEGVRHRRARVQSRLLFVVMLIMIVFFFMTTMITFVFIFFLYRTVVDTHLYPLDFCLLYP